MRVICVVNGPFRPNILENHGDFSQLLRRAVDNSAADAAWKSETSTSATPITSDDVHWTLFHAFEEGAAFPAPTTFDAVILSGSRYNITEGHAWVDTAADWLRSVTTVHAKPVLGICFGHQLLCHAFGGKVDWNPAGNESGTIYIRRKAACGGSSAADWNPQVGSLDGTPASSPGTLSPSTGVTPTVPLAPVASPADMDPLVRLAALPAHFDAIAYHNQTIIEPPQGAITLFDSDKDNFQVLRHTQCGRLVYSTQFHPEFTRALMMDYAPHLTFKTEEDRAAFVNQLKDAPVAQRIVSSFLLLARETLK